MNICRQADDTLAVVSLDKSGHGSELKLRKVRQFSILVAVSHDREFSDVINALHAVLGKLHLNLESVARVGIAPIVRLCKPRGGGGRYDGADDVRHCQTELACTVPVDMDVQRGVV